MKSLFLSLVIITTFIMYGCTAGVLGSAVIITKTFTDPRSIGTQIDDTTLELRVTNMLSTDREIKKNTHVVATAYEGNILLTGQSQNADLVQRAEKIARSVYGTKEVYNQIRVNKKSSLRNLSLDTWITTKIRSKLLISDKVNASHLKVITENGEVFLLGVLTPLEAKIASNLASKVSGVKHVITGFSILQ